MSGKTNLRLAAAGVMGLAMMVVLEGSLARELLSGLALLTANLTNEVLLLLGVEAKQQGTIIAQPYVFAYEIHYRCLAILPASALLIAIVIHPARLRAKLVGISIGLPVLFALNIFRLVHLFLVGSSLPNYFWMAHHVFWNIVMFVSVALLFLSWLRWLNGSSVVSGKCSSTKGVKQTDPVCEPMRVSSV